MVWEGDEPNDVRKLTYEEVLRKVCQIANALLRSGVKKGDIVTVYMPMIPELAMTVSAWYFFVSGFSGLFLLCVWNN
jgi:acetyl-CoA synthetase